jgi:glycerol-3-phosphate acyltransferase PlsX
VRIAVDAMGGDLGPEIVAKGAISAARLYPSDLIVVLVGDRSRLDPVVRKEGLPNVEVAHATEIVGMSEPPASAIRKKKDSSIAVAYRLLKEGGADGLVSPGNTGAVVAGALVTIGRLHGVSRPAITTFYPAAKRWAVVLDVGANSVCTPKNLWQFGVMGSVFAEYQLDIEKPRVGLLNIGEEKSKGTEVIQEAYTLLESGGLNFVGNVEGRDIMKGAVDVCVCDGFVGNVVLKFTESILSYTRDLFRKEIKKTLRSRIGAVLMKSVFHAFRTRLDYAEYGGAPLLGVNGVVIICHGKSSMRAIKNAILLARRSVESDVNGHIEERFKGLVSNLAKVT